ncbi:lipase maturation factor [Diaminobutyricimonas aerilata]|uniref:Lipase maturation factor n=1 Tax=Diaminobutyricimonas aerilata TaxID=1162967 RepID=A0A2M9CLW4_9MICO|nr:lipase maturation factor family protein [Diaminobutyricimonas aerilata]PJJ72874.1 lipase maturation factor [Diaminobutyricimonas aerilata]
MEWPISHWFDAHDYEFARLVLQRGVAAVYVVAFLSTAAQFRPLLGERGLLPVPELLERARHLRGPTLFRWRYSDRMLLVVAWTGVAIAASLVLGLPQLGPPWVPMLAFLALWFLYLSIVNVGQTFYGFGWEMLLVEAGFTVAFLGSDQVPPPLPVLVLVVWLVFRLEFGAGMIKMRGDRVWRDLTALYYHHETQPMPNPVSRFAHLLPKPIHRLEVVGNHIAQLVVPFLLFVPGWVGSIAALVVIATQLWLVISGNFAWLNVLTIVLAFAPITDSFMHAVIPAAPLDWGSGTTSPLWWMIVVGIVTVGILVLSWPALRNLFSRRQLMNAAFNRLNLGNAYGAFGSVTRERYEVVVEGTRDENPRSAEWLEYEFKGKPGDVRRTPRQFAPYHLRLDWLMWFLALGSPGEQWFIPFLAKLLEADRTTLRLLRRDPFDGERPRWVRARLYLYRFSTREEKRRTGAVWVREPVGEYARPMSLRR